MNLTLITVGAATAGVRCFPQGTEEARDLDRFRAAASTLRGAERMLRSPATVAASCAMAAGLPDAALDRALRDRDYGAWAGQPVDAVAASDPDLFARWLDAPDAAPAGGESVNSLVFRMQAWLAHLEAENTRVLAFTHPAVVRACLATCAGSPQAWFAFDIGHATRTVLTRHGARWRIRLVNAPL